MKPSSRELETINFAEVRSSLGSAAVFSNKGARLLLEFAEEWQKAAIEATEYATFLEGLIHDLREEKGLPPLTDVGEWEKWKKDLPVRCRKMLNRLRIGSFVQLCSKSADDLLEQKNFSYSSLDSLERRLAEKGLRLRPPDLTN